MLKLTAWCDR